MVYRYVSCPPLSHSVLGLFCQVPFMFHFQSPENNSIFVFFLWDDFIARFLDSFVHHFVSERWFHCWLCFLFFCWINISDLFLFFYFLDLWFLWDSCHMPKSSGTYPPPLVSYIKADFWGATLPLSFIHYEKCIQGGPPTGRVKGVGVNDLITLPEEAKNFPLWPRRPLLLKTCPIHSKTLGKKKKKNDNVHGVWETYVRLMCDTVSSLSALFKLGTGRRGKILTQHDSKTITRTIRLH